VVKSAYCSLDPCTDTATKAHITLSHSHSLSLSLSLSLHKLIWTHTQINNFLKFFNILKMKLNSMVKCL